jgi:glycine betaine/proline transport system substrate-binding protein
MVALGFEAPRSSRGQNGEEKRMKRTTIIAGALAAALPGTAALAQSDCGEVSITEMNWASSAIVTAVSKFLMEQGYGCDVTTVPSSTTPALASVAETGTPDILTELWINGAPTYDEMSEAGTIVTLTDVLSDGGVEGWWIPTVLAEAYPELTTIDGVLANPDLVGNRFHQCPEGWGCKNISASLAEALNLEEAGIEIFQHGSGETMATSIASAVENGEPWLGYYWAPTSVLGKYEMTQVDLGEYDEEIHTCNADPECEEVGISAFPVGPVKTVVTTDFQEENPAIAELMSNVSFTNEQMNTVLAWQEVNSASAEEAAVYFLTNYQDVWADWLSEDARENLSALLQ